MTRQPPSPEEIASSNKHTVPYSPAVPLAFRLAADPGVVGKYESVAEGVDGSYAVARCAHARVNTYAERECARFLGREPLRGIAAPYDTSKEFATWETMTIVKRKTNVSECQK